MYVSLILYFPYHRCTNTHGIFENNLSYLQPYTVSNESTVSNFIVTVSNERYQINYRICIIIEKFCVIFK